MMMVSNQQEAATLHNDGEIRVTNEQIFEVIRRGLCLPPTYRVWAFCATEDHTVVLVESDELPATDYNGLIPLLEPEIQTNEDGSARLIRIHRTHKGCTATLPEE